MAYKTILVCLNEIGAVPQLINVASSLGAKFGAHIKGLYVIPSVNVYPATAYVAPPQIYEGNRQFYEKHRDDVQKSFESAMKREGLNFDFELIDSSIPEISMEVIKNSRDADLLVISATSRDHVNGVEYDIVERVMIGAGRPVLVLPYKMNKKFDVDEVIVGWDDSREAARAAFDAVPLLKTAKRVRIVSVDGTPSGTIPGAEIAEALDRHGVKVETANVSSDGLGTGEALMRAANDYGAGLVVMGGYGHSRFAELVFGGVTRHVTHHLDRPVLMSH